MKYGDLIQNEGIYEVRAGFKKAWQEHDYATIIAVAEKIPETVLQEDPKLLMWYDQAATRSEMGWIMLLGFSCLQINLTGPP